MPRNRTSWKLISFASLSDASADVRVDESDGFAFRDEALLCAARALSGGDRMLKSGSVVKIIAPDAEEIMLMRVADDLLLPPASL